MDVVASTAAVAQLLGQTISLVQQIRRAREQVEGLSARLDQSAKELSDAYAILSLLENHNDLQTANVARQVAIIKQICEEIVRFIHHQTLLSGRSTGRQYLHAFGKDSRDERTMEQMFDRLNRAKMSISLHIQLAHVGILGNLRDGFVAVLPIIERIDQSVQSTLGSRLRIAKLVEESKISLPGSDRVPLQPSVIQNVDAEDGSAEAAVGRSYVGNKTFDQAQQINSDIGAVEWRTISTVVYKDNEARDKSVQVNAPISIDALKVLLDRRVQ